METIDPCDSCIFFQKCMEDKLCEESACCLSCLANGFICEIALKILNKNRKLVCNFCGKILNMKEFRNYQDNYICKLCYATHDIKKEEIENNFCEKYQINCLCASCKTPCVKNPCQNCWVEKGLKPPEARNCWSTLFEDKYLNAHNSIKELKRELNSFFEELYLLNSLITSTKKMKYSIITNQFKKIDIDILIRNNYLNLKNNIIYRGKYYSKSLTPKKILKISENKTIINIFTYISIYDLIKTSKFKKYGINIQDPLRKLERYKVLKKLRNGLYKPHNWIMVSLKKISKKYSFDKLQEEELIKVFTAIN